MDGTSSHGSSLDDLPNSVKKRVKEYPEYKRKKKSTKSKASFILYHIDEIKDAIEAGAEVAVVGGMTISICVILNWAMKLGLMFLFV